MAVKIYVVYNLGQYNHLIYRMLRDLEVETKLIENSTPPEEIDADGLVIGGGPSMEKSGRSADYVRELDIPILGICLGHQIIANVFGGRVDRGDVGGYAENEVSIIEEDELFIGFPEKIRVWESHMDEVKVLPENFELLATSSICEIEAMKHKRRPVYGVQWHPEVYHSEYGEELYSNFIEICKR
ncbi:GMP synthase subunit A [Geoglobus acetivorans]|uniref:GMP synthase [glutamine-hydrolyzing] subunit A n=1 Tax=Geoglobus acetivorans TaxID=565033 RepID=A0A0A7GET4_GEOAI|nr:GMP synthase [glutamine-hydrolyzing], amidotransferase subunit [Geoglobus acetivorans]